MKEYHKINTIYKRNMEAKHKPLIVGDWSDPIFEYLADNIWEWDEKIDGTNIRIMISRCVEFGGKTDNAEIPKKLNEYLHATFLPQSEKLFDMFPEGACLYGEGVGEGIQKGGGNYSPDQIFILFDVLVGHMWLKRDAVREIAKDIKIPSVPLIGRGNLHEMSSLVKCGFTSRLGNFISEGVVARPEMGLCDRRGQRIIAKLKHKDFKEEKV